MFQTNTNTLTKISDNASQTTHLAWKSINSILDSFVSQLPYIAAGLIVLGIFFLLSKFIKTIFWSASGRTKLDFRLRVLFSRVVGFSIVALGVFTALTIIIPSFKFGDLIAGLGFTSFVVGFATKDILNNLLSGILILWKQPFHLGDYIFINKFQGKVEQIGVRATRLRADDGEQILIPNGDLYSNPLIVRGAGAQRRMNLSISVGYETEIGMAKDVIENAMKSVTGVVAKPEPVVYVRDLASEGINLGIYFWIETNENRPLEIFDHVATEIKNALNRNKIDIYPPNNGIVRQTESDSEGEVEKKKDDLE
ncbi:MAG: mechanosensitive ion channel family protein [Pyrinomonadaceae bacterium]